MNARRLGPGLRAAATPVAAGLIALGWYLLTIAPTIAVLHDNVDGAELIAVAQVWGVAHPPGAALWIPLGHAALTFLTTVEEPALRTNLLSALLMAAAVAFLTVAARRWRPETPAWAAGLAGLIGGLAPLVWAQAIVTEVLALQMLLTSLALVLVIDAAAGRRWTAFALVLGLLAWNHPTGLALAVLLALAAGVHGRPPTATLARAAVAFLAPGAYTVAYLLLRAAAPIAWGDTSTATGVLDHLSGAGYRDLGVLDFAPAALASSLPETLRRVLREVPPPLWPALPAGALLLARARPLLASALGVASAILVLFVSGYRATGREDYLATVVFAAALLAAWGTEAAWDWLRPHLPGRAGAFWMGLAAAGLLSTWGALSANAVTLRGDTRLRDEAVARLEAASQGATIDTRDDMETFPLWYAQVVLGVRRDVTLRDTRGLAPVIRGAP